MRRFSNILFLLFFLILTANAQDIPSFLKNPVDPEVDSLLNKLTTDQKIGQLFMVQAYSSKKNQQTESLLEIVKNYEVGGVIFMQGEPTEQARITNLLQKASKIPLLVAMDAETGLGFRLDSTISYPIQMALGAVGSDSLIYRMGYEIGKQCRRIGITMNMAPVSDINLNPDNPVINFRSFGEDRAQVARKSWLYASGMQAAGVLATAKHFPGHGNTDADSHRGLPLISQSKNQLDSVELFPFSYLIQHGIGAIMTGHLEVPALDATKNIPATLSGEIIHGKLKKDLGFKGLVITDAMNMKGISDLYSSAESSVMALKAGNDMLEIIPRLDRAIAAVKLAVKNGELLMAEIDVKCRKILAVKKWLKIDKQINLDAKNMSQYLNSNSFRLTKKLLHEQSITLLSNQGNLVPLQNLDTLKIASLMIGSDQVSPFQKMLENYTSIDHFNIGKTPTDSDANKLLNSLKSYNLVIIGINGMGMYPGKRFGITDQQINLVNKLDGIKSVVCFFGNPYALPNFPALKRSPALLIAYQNDPDAQESAAQAVFGAISASGTLPVSVKDWFDLRSGIRTIALKRLKYTFPEEVGISSNFLQTRIDSLVELGMVRKAFPGCQILIAREGKVIFSKSYGFYTYEKLQPVTNNSLYDLASVTKISAPLPAIMKLTDENKIKLDAPFANYFRQFSNTNKSEMTVRDILTHQARLQSGIPFWLEPGSASKLREGLFRKQPSEKFQIRVSSEMYARNDIKKLIIADIVKSPLRSQKEFHYSDLGFSLFPDVIDSITGIKFPDFLRSSFFKPLGAENITFNPYQRFPISQIVPTENDRTFRKELLQGFVHDELAALLGGISGNAGLFSNANDLAKLMQMYLQSGYYGGIQFIRPETVREFTRTQFPNTSNRRALGFDKPKPADSRVNSFPAQDASPESFGHTGFTGTFCWMDPNNQVLLVFLSNRVYPTRRATALIDLNIRSKIHQTIYDAIKRGIN